MKYVIGWLKLKPGMREAFVAFAKDHDETTRRESGCLFYQSHPSAADPDELVVVEGWQTPEHHAAHEKAPHHVALGNQAGKYIASGQFEEIEAAKVKSVRF